MSTGASRTRPTRLAATVRQATTATATAPIAIDDTRPATTNARARLGAACTSSGFSLHWRQQ